MAGRGVDQRAADQGPVVVEMAEEEVVKAEKVDGCKLGSHQRKPPDTSAREAQCAQAY